MSGSVFDSTMELAVCCYGDHDRVTRRSRCHANRCLRNRASVNSVERRGCSAMGRPPAPTAQRVARTRRSGRMLARWCSLVPQLSRRCRSIRVGCAPKRIPSPVPGAMRWRPWSSILAPYRAIAVTRAAQRWREKAQPCACGACGRVASRRRRLLQDLSPRNIGVQCLICATRWGESQEVWMQDPPRRGPRPLQVRVSFEPTRLASDQLAAAYDQVLPEIGRRRGVWPTHAHPPALPAQAPHEQEQA